MRRPGTNHKQRPCRQCGQYETRSLTGLCWACRPAPTVWRDGDSVHVSGLGRLTHDNALTLAHRLADELSP